MKKLKGIETDRCPLNFRMMPLVIVKNVKSVKSKTKEKTRDNNVKIDKCVFFKIILMRVRDEIEP